MRQLEVEIRANREVAPGWRELALGWDRGAGIPRPGQFLSLRVSPRNDPLLRRPFAFSAARPDGSGVELVYQVRGPATELLASLAPGSRLDALGPLGRGFPAPRPGEAALLAAGGIGLGPILFLARSLAGAADGGASDSPALLDARGAPLLGASAGAPVRAVFGFRTAASLPLLSFPPGASFATEDGGAGFHGSVGDWLASLAEDGRPTRLHACGPGPMLAALARLARERGWEGSFAAEQWMACGVGACMGCALPRADGAGFLRACADGPVFGRDEIDWGAA